MPVTVRRIIEARAAGAGFPALKRAAGALSDTYREGRPARMMSDDHVTAYLVTRMPATYAAALGALPDLPVDSVLEPG